MAKPFDAMKTFFTIWFGQVISSLGSGLTNFGITVWVLKTTGSTTAFATAMIFATLPGILLSPIAGTLADRWDRRTAMIVSDFGAGLSSLVLALLVMTGNLHLWGIYALMGVSSAFNTLSWPAFTASTSILVPKEHLGRASGLVQAGEAASMIVTPALGAFLLVKGGLQALVIIDVVSFALAIGALLLIRISKPAPTSEPQPQQSFFREAFYGWRYIKARPGLFGLMAFFFLVNFVAGFANVLYGPLTLALYDEQFLGVVGSTIGIAMLVGTIIMGVWGGPKKKVYGIIGFSLAIGFGLLIMILPATRPTLLASAALMMVFTPIMNGCSQAIWQRKVALDVQGRVFAIRRMIAWFPAPLSFALAGPLADRVFGPGLMPKGNLAPALGPIFGTGEGAGVRVMMVCAGLLMFVVAGASLLNPRVRNVEQELPDAKED